MNNSITEAINYCTECGTPIKEQSKFCANCGKPLVDDTQGENSLSIAKENVGSKKIFSEQQVLLGTLFGGPIVTGSMMSKNYKELGKPISSKNALIRGILGSALIAIIAIILPENVDKGMSKLAPIIYTVIGMMIFQKYQKSDVQAALLNGGQKESGLKVFSYTIVGIAVYIGLFLFIYAIPNSSEFKTIVSQEDGIEEYNKGVDYQQTNQLELAEQQFKLAIQKNTHLAEAYLNLGLIYMNNGWIEGAEEMTLKSISLFKNSSRTIVTGNTLEQSLSIAYNNLGIIEIGKAAEFEGSYNYSLAKTHWEKGMKDFYEAVNLDPTNSQAHANIKRFEGAY